MIMCVSGRLKSFVTEGARKLGEKNTGIVPTKKRKYASTNYSVTSHMVAML